MSVLNDLTRLSELDPAKMYECIYEFPAQINQAQEIGSKISLNRDQFSGIRNVTLIGMGGSAIGGDVVRSLCAHDLQVPFLVNRNYRLPDYVDDESLVIASSYSGNTEETLTALAEAIGRKAMIAGVTTGGKLEEISRAEGFPIVKVPAGLQPRAALGLSFVPLLYLLENLGLVNNVDTAITEASLHLQTARELLSREAETDGNPAKQIAGQIQAKLPIIYSGPDLTEPAAVRWRGQIAENGKALGYSSVFPEMNHNELVGWSRMTELYRDKLAVVLLRDEEDNARVALRMNLFAKRLHEAGVSPVEVQSSGAGRLARLLSLIQIGDFVSYYLSALNEVNPTPVEAIESLKRELASVS